MNGIVLHGVVGEQDEADVAVGFAGRQLKLGVSVLIIFDVLAPHREFDGVLAGVRSVTRVLQWGVSGFLCLGRLFQGQPNEAALCI